MASDHDEALHPKRAWLNEQIREGSIDTLVVALTDMQGRLMGKRVQGQAFLAASSTTVPTSARISWAPTWR